MISKTGRLDCFCASSLLWRWDGLSSETHATQKLKATVTKIHLIMKKPFRRKFYSKHQVTEHKIDLFCSYKLEGTKKFVSELMI
jgi:hypothetical protein